MIEIANISVRQASREDNPAIAALLVQLYHAEAPGALTGPLDGQRQLLRFVLDQGGIALTRRCYIAVGQDGQAIGTASLRLPMDPATASLPPGMLRMAVRLLGWGGALRMFGRLIQAAFTPDSSQPPDAAFIHSVVVDARYRSLGVGRLLMAEVERRAHDAGMRATRLRVVVGNRRARYLYQRLGYQIIGRSPRWLDWATFPTEIMQKQLAGKE